ncbi:MAG: Hsp70 family protein, partial [Armatimonadetes bacterium]|nr:Hsp70 family protein [Armatimonadota bacterium]
EVARIFMREVFRAVKEQYHETIRDLTITVPVDAFENYRAELQQIMGRLGVKRLQTLDEPVAAALGYGLNTEREMNLLVFDFGGGTMDIALVRTCGPGKAGTPAEVVAKQGLALGGNNVDVWLVEHFAQQFGFDVNLWRDTEWYQALIDEAQRLKEQLYAQETAQLMLSDRMMVELGLRGKERPKLTRQELVDLLTRSGMYTDIDRILTQVVEEMRTRGMDLDDIDEVLVVGGSTLLPEVHARLEAFFGRPRLRDWLPFEAVAYGACVFASGQQLQDFIRHDYALLMHDRETKKPEYPIIVPRGTVYPTEHIVWEQNVCPTCPRNEPASEFELRIYEVSRARGAQREIAYDDQGRLRVLDKSRDDEPVMLCLNETDPTLGRLSPPYQPDHREARLHIGFRINGDRFLTATVRDLQTSEVLMNDQPVVKLR